MEVIKIYPLDESILNDAHLSEEENETLFCNIIEAIKHNDNQNAISTIMELSEFVPSGLNARNEPVKPIPVIINGLQKWIKNVYALKVKKILDHSKELNDLYNKVNALLESDRKTQFKHRNDLLTINIHDTVLLDTASNKRYNLTADFFAYNPDYFVNTIESMIKNSQELGDKFDLMKVKDSVISELEANFARECWYLTRCIPTSTTKTYTKIKLKDGLRYYQTSFENFYQFIYGCNKCISYEIEYTAFMQKAYNSMLAKYGKDKKYKKVIDDIFSVGLKHMAIGLDFNNQVLDIADKDIKFYAEAIEKIYEYLKKY